MDVTTSDTAEACADPNLPWVADALDVQNIERALGLLPRVRQSTRVRRARVTRHKPFRRCAIEYDLEPEQRSDNAEFITTIGRIRARHDGVEDFARVDALWSGAFGEWNDDGISVPEPIGAIPSLHMWLQYKAPGRLAGEVLTGGTVSGLPERIAETAHKIHTNGGPTSRRHTVIDELFLLDRYLGEVCRIERRWCHRINRVLERCRALAAQIETGSPATIHGDFYHDQLIVHDWRVYVVDFDLYAHGDPALDVGNFVAHLTELALRTTGNPLLLSESEERLVERFLQLAGPGGRRAIAVYTMLALARHIYLSVARPGRSATTDAVLQLCEERLELASESSVSLAGDTRRLDE